MININFVPDDYVRSAESRKTNIMYLVLFFIVMAGLTGAFLTIKLRLRALNAREALVNDKITSAKDAIKQFEELQEKRKSTLKTALTAAELLEPVPRSVLLALLTNNLPPGVSLLRLNLVQKQPKAAKLSPSSNYKARQAAKAAAAAPKISPEKLLVTHIDIHGIAPSDLQVAAYIKQLIGAALLDNVALVESKEYKTEQMTFRQFKLTAMLRKDVHLTDEDIKSISAKGDNIVRTF